MMDCLLLSGGIDSVSLACWKRPHVAITIDYGQKPAQAEIRVARRICNELRILHEVVRVDCSSLGSGDLAGKPPERISVSPEWWPFRNQLLLTLGATKGLSLGVNRIYFGVVKSDSFHCDGRAEFFENANSLLKMQEGGIEVLAPAIKMTSAELVRTAGIDISLLAWAHSCHTSNFACGDCRGCFKREAVMKELGYEPS